MKGKRAGLAVCGANQTVLDLKDDCLDNLTSLYKYKYSVKFFLTTFFVIVF